MKIYESWMLFLAFRPQKYTVFFTIFWWQKNLPRKKRRKLEASKEMMGDEAENRVYGTNLHLSISLSLSLIVIIFIAI